MAVGISSEPHIASVPLLVGGVWMNSQSAERLHVSAPVTGLAVAEVPVCTVNEISEAIEAARVAFNGWKCTPVESRRQAMLRYQSLVRQHARQIADLIVAEQEEGVVNAGRDIIRSGLEEFDCVGATGDPDSRSDSRCGTGPDKHHLHRPVGVCVGIAHSNSPAMDFLWMFPLATLRGNTFVLKPSHKAPFSTMELARLACTAGFSPGVLNIVHGADEVVGDLCTHPAVKAIYFSGPSADEVNARGLAMQHGKCVISQVDHQV